MAMLTDQEIDIAWARYMEENGDKFSLDKDDVRAAIVETDIWIEDNKVSYNNALPQVAKDELSSAQKSAMLTIVAFQRFGGGI